MVYFRSWNQQAATSMEESLVRPSFSKARKSSSQLPSAASGATLLPELEAQSWEGGSSRGSLVAGSSPRVFGDLGVGLGGVPTGEGGVA